MRRRNLLLVLATGAAFALSAGVGTVALSAGAATGTTTYPTTVDFLGGAGFQTDGIVVGKLDTSSKCRGLRRVTMYEQTPSGYTEVDHILSSARGAWAFRYDIPANPTRFRFAATRDTRNGTVCEADALARMLGGSSPRAGAEAPSAGVAKGVTTYPTNIHWRVRGFDPTFVAGQLDTHAPCANLRPISMYKLTSSGYRRVDSIFSSARGAWGFLYEADTPGPTQVRFKTPELIRRHDTVLCKRDTQDETFD